MEQIDVLSESYRKYPQLLEGDGNTYINIDMAQSGLVCRNSWGAIPMEQYRIPYQAHEFKFMLIPVGR
jgi:beta-galactosidase